MEALNKSGETSGMEQDNNSLGSRNPLQSVDAMLHHGLQHQAMVRPDAPAVKQDSVTYTFGQLNNQANRVAQDLLNRAGTGTALIGILMPNPAHQLIAAAGIWKAGMTALILDNNDPKNRLQQVLDDAGVDLILAAMDLDKQASGLNRDVMIIEPDGRSPISTNLDIGAGPESPCCNRLYVRVNGPAQRGHKNSRKLIARSTA